MSKKSAFPIVTADRAWEDGMTLRDYFAARALCSGVARESVPEYDLRAMFGPNRTAIRREEIMAADAYRIADAMLKARDAVSSQKEPS